jgi:hypothetical protein
MKNTLHSCLAVVVVFGGLSSAAIAFAQSSGSIPCDGVKQNKQACQRERAAAAATRFPKADEESLQQNALARCGRLPSADHDACVARVTGSGSTTISGSVLGGGVLRVNEAPAK